MRYVHLWLGLASGLVVMVVCLTGAILVFEKEIDEWVNHKLYFTEAQQGQRLPLDSLLANARAYDKSIKVSNIVLETADPGRNILFSGKKKDDTHIIAIDPYTGTIAGSVNDSKQFFTIVLKLHRYLLMKDTGKIITGISCLIFIALVLTGLILWWPKKRKQLKQRLAIKWDSKFKRLNWDLHAIGGFYVHLVILVIAVTGLTWSYKWVNNSLFVLFDGKPQQKFQVPANTVQQAVSTGFYEEVYQDANKRLAYKGKVNISIPAKDSLAITVSKENREASITNIVDYLYYEKGTGRLLKERLYENETTGMKVRRAIYPIHTGNIYGWPTKLLAFFSVLFAASLPVTGFMIWLKRGKKAQAKLVRVPREKPIQPIPATVTA